ncbi:albumin-2-like [Punica granatum]|uniref:Albumin-2-like n=2 Tax=Punica granatum TaxID=22663 RepID=A0A6P8C8N1_PUNGR|nr:albumin-2-like [Punica granatum]XP_031380034.1 albumin-2-like [Punica granatum]XP_031380039.1 albumin-2-like [Punica granatum]OWM63224.1 hypothetical protein CDL15_Pgr010624 [Punica granatum]PKI36009.1 hypothetical protein CRG98_043584 [Punica granatum]
MGHRDLYEPMYPVDAAFRSSRTNEAYVFKGNMYVLINYAPGTQNDKAVNRPLLIRDGFPSLADTPFGDGIDCAFGSHYRNEAFIFKGDLCAVVNYAPHTTNDWIVKGPMTIASMFPFLRGTVFEKGIDAAFESSRESEAYLFRSDQYARINYGSSPHLITMRLIAQGFPTLRNTIFEHGIEAAFASHRYNEAYIFNLFEYALINFAPGTTNDYIIGGVKPIYPNWPSLGGYEREPALTFADVLFGEDVVRHDESELHNHLSQFSSAPEPDPLSPALDMYLYVVNAEVIHFLVGTVCPIISTKIN